MRLNVNPGTLVKEAIVLEKTAHDLRVMAHRLMNVEGHKTFHGNADKLVALLKEEGEMKPKLAAKRLKMAKVTVYAWVRKNPGVFKRSAGVIRLLEVPAKHH